MIFQCEVLRSVGLRDNNWKPSASNDPSTATIGWLKNAGVTATSDGDILSLSGTTSTNGLSISPLLTSTTTYPNLVIRAKAASAMTIDVLVGGLAQTVTFSLTTSYQTLSKTLNSGAALSLKFLNQSLAGTVSIDYVYLCGKTPLQLAATDLANGTVTRVGTGGVDHAQLRLNNRGGKFVTGSNAIGYGDHLHIYLGQGATPFHVYGGYVENIDPNMPADMVEVQSRGFGVALLESLVLNQYQTSTPQTILNDVVDNFVNAANKNGLGITSNYQLTRSYVQNIGSSVGLYISNMKNAHDALKEITDLTTAQGTPAVFFVDPAENLHFVPLGSNWNTDPFTAVYPQTITVGKDQITNKFRKDVTSLRNRVHYFAVAQSPAVLDGWTENTASSWKPFSVSSNTTIDAQENVTSPVALGTYSVHFHMKQTDDASSTGVTADFAYPAAKNLGLDINSLGSTYSPPLLEFFFRTNYFGPSGPLLISGVPHKIIFGTDQNATSDTDYYAYNLISDATRSAQQSVMNLQVSMPANDYWNHIIVPIGPHGGTQFLNPPLPNTITTATYTGTSQYSLGSTGNPSWANINYIGLFWSFLGIATGQAQHQNMHLYLDGWRVLGGRYVLAYDNRATAYRDMREIHFYDPIAKDEASIRNFALAELLRLWNPVRRGGFHTTLRADALPEQQVLVTAPSANLSSSPLRTTQIVHRFSNRGMFTEYSVSDDFTNSQPIEAFRLVNAILQMGDNAVFSREIYDLKTSVLDPSFKPVIIHP